MKTYAFEISLTYERALNAKELATVREILEQHLCTWNEMDGLALYQDPGDGVGDTDWPLMQFQSAA
ncbi:hypothetical protein AMST5_03063 [freshwater sediment metagenome]|uniref:Uncharacterized protein n=1 Tax=freshwater sediment metagenome TaxID=556182 RepID=A0AA48REA6_9ZZZZ